MDTNNTNNSINSVYASDFVNIVEGPHKGIFKIFFAYPSRALINSLIKTKIIQGESVPHKRVQTELFQVVWKYIRNLHELIFVRQIYLILALELCWFRLL